MCLSGTVLFILTFLFNPHNNPNGGFSICMLQERKVLISPSLKVTQLVTESRLELLVRWNYFSLIFTYLYIINCLKSGSMRILLTSPHGVWHS